MFRMATGLRSRIFIPDLSILAGDGKLYDAQACREELETYRRQSEFFLQNIMKSRTEWRIVWGEIQAKSSLYGIFLAGARSEA